MIKSYFHMMIFRQINSEKTRLTTLRTKRVGIERTVDKTAESVLNNSVLTHMISRLTVEVKLRIIAVAVTLGLQTKPVVSDRARFLVDACGKHRLPIAVSLAWIKHTLRVIVVKAVDHVGASHELVGLFAVHAKVTFVVTLAYRCDRTRHKRI